MLLQILYPISNSEERTSGLCKEDFVGFMLNLVDEITNGILTIERLCVSESQIKDMTNAC